MATTLAELLTQVQVIVKRPDLQDDVILHTKNAILKVHSADYWKGDLYETAFSFAVADVNYSLDIYTLIPRFKKTRYLNVIDPISRDIVRSLTPIDPLQFYDSYNYIRDWVFYEAGTNIQIRVSDKSQYFGIGVYLSPDTTLTAPSWIANQFPFAIVYEAARTLFKATGRDEQSTAMQSLVGEAMAEIKMVGIPTIGE